MSNKTKRLTLTIIFLLGIVALSAGSFVAQHIKSKNDMSQFKGTLLSKPRAMIPFSLTGTDGQPFNNASLNGSWTMVFFGFTHCGYMCPTTMGELGKMYRLLQEQGVKTRPQVVMISVDPERDSLEKLGHYVTAFDSHFYGARGSEESISTLAREMGIAYIKVTRKDEADVENYDIEHTGTVMLINPQGQLAAFFTTPHQAELLAKDYTLLAAKS